MGTSNSHRWQNPINVEGAAFPVAENTNGFRFWVLGLVKAALNTVHLNTHDKVSAVGLLGSGGECAAVQLNDAIRQHNPLHIVDDVGSYVVAMLCFFWKERRH